MLLIIPGAMKSARRACIALLAVWVAACTTTPVAPPGGEPGIWQAPDWAAWRLTGRISVKYRDDGWNAGLVWRQSRADYDLKLHGPLGQGALRLSGNDQRVELLDSKGARDAASDAETLMRRHLGWQLPLSGLKYWIQGKSQPGLPAQWRRDAGGRPEQLIQSGWRIDYDRFRPAPDGASMPRRIDFERPDLQARLIIDRWEILTEAPVAANVFPR